MRDWIGLFGAADGDESDDDLDAGDESMDAATRTLTAKEIDSMVAAAAKRATRKAARDLASDLGFDTAGELKAWVQEQQDQAEAAKSEEQKVLDNARKASQEAAELKASLARERLDIQIERAVIAAGISDAKKSSRITTLVKADIGSDIDLNDMSAWETPIADALESVKSDAPELFNVRSGFGSGDGGATGESSPDDGDKEQAALEERIEKEYAAKGWL